MTKQAKPSTDSPRQAGVLTPEKREALEREVSGMIWDAEGSGEAFSELSARIVQRVLDCVSEAERLGHED